MHISIGRNLLLAEDVLIQQGEYQSLSDYLSNVSFAKSHLNSFTNSSIAIVRCLPTQIIYLSKVITELWYITYPTTITTCIANLSLQPHLLNYHGCNLLHLGTAVRTQHIYIVRFVAVLNDVQDACHQILHINVWLALLSIAKNLKFSRILLQLVDEVVDYTMSEALTHHIREAGDPHLNLICRSECRDKRLTCQLACSIVAYRTERTVVLVQDIVCLAKDSRGRCKEELLHLKLLHQLKHIEGSVEGEVIIHHRILTALLNIRVCSKVVNHVELAISKNLLHSIHI